MEFKIKSIVAIRAGYSNEMDAKVTVSIDSKLWAKIKKQKQLGQLYGIDISNAVYKLMNGSISAIRPSVDDKSRASNGVKSITLNYSMNQYQIKSLGINQLDYCSVLWTEGRANLRAVGA